MSATTGIPSRPIWGGESSLPWTERFAGTRTITASKETAYQGPPNWLTNSGQILLAVFFTILSIPLMVIAGIVAAVVAAWALLLPALLAGFVIVLVSFVAPAV